MAVTVSVDYRSMEGEDIASMILVLFPITERPTVEMCKALWNNMTPNFLVQLDMQAYSDFQTIVIKAKQRKLPLVCGQAITGIVLHNMGISRPCPAKVYLHTQFPFPAVD